MVKWLKNLRDIFYAGPKFLGVEPYRRNGYQSPTLTIALWIYAFVVRHLSMGGRIVLICSSLIVLYAMFSLLMPIHLLAFAIIMIFVLDALVGLLLLPRLHVTRSAPARMSAGAEQRITYTVENRAKHPAWNVFVDSLPFPSTVSLPEGRAFVDTLEPGERCVLQATVRTKRRGLYTLPALRSDSAFPFNLWRWGSMGDGPQRLIVYPEFTRLNNLAMAAGLRYQSGGIALSSHVGESMEFLSCREFRSGDDPRRLHWRSWARTSYPVVKEFREEYLCRTALILDTHRPKPPWLHLKWAPPPDPTFEGAVSIAAAVADYLAEQDYVVDLFAAGPEVYRFRAGRSLGFLENILDILACLKPHRGEPFAEFSAELIRELAQISSATFVLLTWNKLRRDVIHEAMAAGVAVRAFLVTDDGRMPPDLPDTVTLLHPGDIRAGRCTDL